MGRRSLCGGCGSCERCKHAAYMREWYRRPGNAEAQRTSALASRERRIETIRAYDRARGFRVYDIDKMRARIRLNHAIVSGIIEKQPCEVCGSTTRIHGHHEDYTKPLEVRWLCPRHHGEVHRMVA